MTPLLCAGCPTFVLSSYAMAVSCKINSNPSNWVKIGWHYKNQLPGTPEVGEKQRMEKRERTVSQNVIV